MNIKFTRLEIGLHLLRYGMAGVFLWFGFSQILDSLRWVSIVPDWAVNLAHLPPAMIVLGNGAFEIILGGLLAMNILVRVSALLLGLHLAVIAFDLGVTAVGVRDFGLVIAALVLALIYGSQKSESVSPVQNPNFIQ